MSRLIARKFMKANGLISKKLTYVQMVEIDDASISVKDVYYLTKAKWTSVTSVNLGIWCIIKGGNNFKNKGCLYLRETEWHELR